MSSFDIAASVTKIRKHMDYDYLNASGEVIALNKSSLVDYISHLRKNDRAPALGEKNGTANVPLLSEDIIDVIVAFLQLFKDLFAANLCLSSFDKNDVVLYSDEGTPKLGQHVTFAELSEDGMDNNVKWLGQLIEVVILTDCDLTDEVEDFLLLFGANGSKNFDLIIVHSAIVPTWQKIDYFCDSHDFLLDYVKELDPAAYTDILNGLVFPADWEMHLPNNLHLENSYCSRDPAWRNMTKKAQALNPSVQPAGNAAACPSSSTQSSLVNPLVQPLGNVLGGPALVQSSIGSAPVKTQNQTSFAPSLSSPSAPLNPPVQPVGSSLGGPALLQSSTGSAPVKTQNQTSFAPSLCSQSAPLNTPLQPVGSSLGGPALLQSKGKSPAVQTPKQLQKKVKSQWVVKQQPSTNARWVIKQPTTQPSTLVVNNLSLNPQPSTPAQPATASASNAGPQPPGPNLHQALPKPKTYNRPGTIPAEEVMKYNRNVGTHGGNDAVKNNQVQYSVKDLSVMLLHYFPKLLCSVLKGLHRNGWLGRMETKSRTVR